MDTVTIGQRLKLRRVAAMLTQKGLAEKVGLQQSAISLFELGKACPMDHVEKIAEVLDCTVADLTDDTTSRPGIIQKTLESSHNGDYAAREKVENLQVDVPPIYGKIGVECQRTVGDIGGERWDRVRVYIEMPCAPEDREQLKGELLENAISSVDETMRKIAQRAMQEPLDLKIT